jgi:hypothetical protein
VTQIVHGPAIFNDQEWDPFDILYRKQDPNTGDKRNGLHDPKDGIEDLLVP